MNFKYGDNGTLSKTSGARVRAVRGGMDRLPGVLDHFKITLESSLQIVDVPFHISISAVDTFNQPISSLNGEVLMTSEFTAFDPERVNLENGEWDGMITALSPGDGHVKVSGSGKEGISEHMQVDGDGQGTGIVQGIVYGTDGTPVSGATVSIVKNDNMFLTQQSRDDGFFEFKNLSFGQYSLWAEQDDTLKSSKFLVQTQRYGCVYKNLSLYSTENQEGLTPILLVPGIMGSSIGGGLWIPILPKESPSWNDPKWPQKESYGLHDPANICGWEKLIDTLESDKYGYKMNQTLFAVPYDWRKDVDDVARDYLKKKIDDALEKNPGQHKVHIIAHSMGGLVTRSYIQSSSYSNDISRFAIIGTPNHGSANAYYMWYGGDPKTADDLTDSIPLAFLNIYSNTTQKLYREMNNEENLFPVYSSKDYSGAKISITDWKSLPAQKKARKFYEDHCKSIRTLLPTYPYLQRDGLFYGNSDNKTLTELNKQVTLKGISAYIFAGKEKKTIQTIHVKTPNGMYTHGVPKGAPDNPEAGDGTVLETSAHLGSIPYYNEFAAGHAELVKVYLDKVVPFITTGQTPKKTSLKSAIMESASNETNLFCVSPEASLYISKIKLATG